MNKTEILNAKITSTKLGEEHGCLTAELFVEGDGWACAFGGYCLDHWFAEVGEHSSSDGYGAIIVLMKTLSHSLLNIKIQETLLQEVSDCLIQTSAQKDL